MYIESKILNGMFCFNRLKQVFSKNKKGPVYTLADLKQIINLGIRINDTNKFL